MRPQQLEVLVIDAIDRAREGNPIEDDRIEFKQEWPDTAKARQLAGAVNRANGNYVIYIVGANEKGDIFALGSTDVADWWAQLSAKFDGVAPDLVNHINVPIEEGKSVTAMEFGTERAPYVVKVDRGGSPEREVPIREGTRTRSATRAELLRMLLPQSSVPPALILSASASSEWNGSRNGSEERCSISGSATIFLEHTAKAGLMLPTHHMKATVEADGRVFPLSTRPTPPRDGQVAPAFGVHVTRDGVVATGPGSFHFTMHKKLSVEDQDFLRGVQEWAIHLTFGVTGSPRAIQLDGQLSRADASLYKSEYQVELGRWVLEPSGDAARD